MEGRAHSSKDYIAEGETSRMMQGLLDCSRNFTHNLKTRRGSIDPPERSRDAHVGIVGAGLAGLRCAEALIEEGISVTMLEARDRLGGRIQQAECLGQLLDMGPNGIDRNPMLQLAAATNSPLSNPAETANVYDSDGMLMHPQIVSDGFNTVWEILTDAFRYSNQHCAEIASDSSLKTFFREKLRASSLDGESQDTVLKLAEIWDGFVGDPVEKQSLRWLWLEECLDGENLYVSNSHRAIIEHVAEAAYKHARILLSTVVQSITSKCKGETSGKVLVKTSNGYFEFDHVVVTVPLGCLKIGSLDFSPDLPLNISRAITRASYSRLEKAFVAFPVPFWETPEPVGVSQKPDVQGTRAMFPTSSHFVHPQYAPEEQRSWTLEMMALSSSTVFGAHAQPILQFCLWGASAARMSATVAKLLPSTEEYQRAIIRLLQPFYNRLPNYKEGCPKCIPVAALATKWQEDDFAGRGSYTNFTIQPDDTANTLMVDDGVRAMRYGIPERGIWFAGEHTAPLVALGTTTGAYWSGESVASRIIEAFK